MPGGLQKVAGGPHKFHGKIHFEKILLVFFKTCFFVFL